MEYNLPKKLYHGTTSSNFLSLKQGIDVNYKGGNPKPDFGVGFYVTSNRDQAQVQANRKTMMTNKPLVKKGNTDLVQPIVLEYELIVKEDQIKNECKIFESPDEEWGSFILSNRMQQNMGTLHNMDRKFPLVYGPMADGEPNLAVLLDLYKKGKISQEEILSGIKPKKNGNNYQDQLSVHSDEAADWLKLKKVWW